MKLSNLLISDRSNFKPYNISPFTLRFSNIEDEVNYRKIVIETSTKHTQFSMLYAIAVAFGYGILDLFIYERLDELKYAYIIRVIFIVTPLIIMLIALSINKFEIYGQIIGQFAYFTVGFGWFMFSYKTTGLIVSYNFSGVIMTFTSGYFFIRLFFVNALPVGPIVLGVFSLSIWSVEMPFAGALSMNASLIVILIFLTLAAYQKELISRQLFVTERKEREATSRQSQIDAQYLAWLRQLAQFLRHEVRQPVAQINTSIELLPLSPNLDERSQTLLETTTLSTKTVWTLIERASRATDATAFVREGKPEIVDISAFLKSTADTFRQTYSGVDIRYTGPSSERVMIDRTALQETVGNILSNAASYADEDTCIDLKLDIEGGQSVVRVSNKGPLIEGDGDQLFNPFLSTRSDSLSEHQGLGLYLVKLIVEHYNGHAWIKNLSDSSGVEASFSLPRLQD